MAIGVNTSWWTATSGTVSRQALSDIERPCNNTKGDSSEATGQVWHKPTHTQLRNRKTPKIAF
jgi:hypothetical protein